MEDSDLPWLSALCKRRYSNKYDAYTTERWFIQKVLREPLLFYSVRSDDAFLIAILSYMPWLPADLEVNVIFVCAEPGAVWQAAELLRHSIDWAKRRGAKCWRLSSDTDFELAPLARRVGAKEAHPRMTLEF